MILITNINEFATLGHLVEYTGSFAFANLDKILEEINKTKICEGCNRKFIPDHEGQLQCDSCNYQDYSSVAD